MTDGEEEKKDKLDKDEIPPDTQINSEHQENNDHEVMENNLNSPEQNQEMEEQIQNGGEQMQEGYEHNEEGEEQMQGGEEEGEGEEQMQEGEEEHNQEEEMPNQESEEQMQEGEEQMQGGEEEGEGEGEEQMQEGEEQILNKEGQGVVGPQQYQATLEGRQYQYNQQGQDGQLYQIDQNGQIVRVIQGAQGREEMQKSQKPQKLEMAQQQMYQYQYHNNELEGAQIAQPIYQTIQHNQIIQERQGYQQNPLMPVIPNYQQNQILQGIHNYQQNQMMQGRQILEQNQQQPLYQRQIYEQNQSIRQVNDNSQKYQQKIIKIQKSKGISKSNKVIKPIPIRQISPRRSEPKDSNPKVHLTSNRTSEKKIIFKNMSYTNQNFGMNSQKQSFVINKNEKQFLKTNRSNLENISNNLNKKNLKENLHEFVEIPRSDYDSYEGKEIIFINDGMDTGEYKFIGEKTLLKESYPNKKGIINQEEIMKEITRRNKVKKQKKVTYEIVDKFYTLTDIRGKSIKTGGNNNNDNKKNDFYDNFYNTNNYKNENNNNNNGNNNDQGGDNGKGGNKQNNENAGLGGPGLGAGSGAGLGGPGLGSGSGAGLGGPGSGAGLRGPGLGAGLGGPGLGSGSAAGLGPGSAAGLRGPGLGAGLGAGASSSAKGSYYYQSSSKGGYYQSSSSNKGGYYQSSGGGYSKSGNYKSDNTGNYVEFRKEIPINNIYNYPNINTTYKNTILSIPSDNYSKYLLEQINKIRTDPQSFIGVIEDARANIKKDRFGRLIYDGKIKIALAQGESAFNEAITFLQNCEPMESLEYISYLTVIPPRNEEEIKDKEDLHKKVEDMINEGIIIRSYWKDYIKDPEISFLLMIVDDNGIKSGMRRKDLLDPNMKYIGISSVEINKKFVCYITLSS